MSTDMTLRDYYAGQALTGILSNDSLFKMIAKEGIDGVDIAKIIANLAGTYADAMIKEKNNV